MSFNLYGYGIDLAENLNYTAIVVTQVTDKVRLKTIRKVKNTSYPLIESLLLDTLFPKYPPYRICTDYTYEKSVSERIEARFNPNFTNQYSKGYQKWVKVDPVIFTIGSKLAMKQNGRKFFESGAFLWPPKGAAGKPEMEALVEELREQMLREAAVLSKSSDTPLKFPKPSGQDNDLIIALELNLWGLRDLLPRLMNDRPGAPAIESSAADVDYWESLKSKNQQTAERMFPRLRQGLGEGAEIIDINVNGESVSGGQE